MADFTNNRTYSQPFFRTVRSNSPQRAIDDAASQRGITRTIGFPSDTPKYYTLIWEHSWVGTSDASRSNSDAGIVSRSLEARGTLRPLAAYRLPLPTHITDGHEINYDSEFNWMEIFGGIARGLNAWATQSIGIAINNLKYVTLLAPKFRAYAYEWKLHPKNAAESQAIRDIYTGIKRGMHPSRFAGRLGFHFPNVFWLGYYPNADQLTKYKPAVITSCVIDYQGGNPTAAFFRNTEAPESIILRLSFLELEVWVSENFANATARADGQPSDPFDATDWFTVR